MEFAEVLDQIFSKKYHRIMVRPGNCYCFNDLSEPDAHPYNEIKTRMFASTMASNNGTMILSTVTSDFFTVDSFLNHKSLKAIMSYVLDQRKEDRLIVVDTLLLFFQIHPGCASYMKDHYWDLMLTKSEEFEYTTLLEYIFKLIEDKLVKISGGSVNTRTSRAQRQKNWSEKSEVEQKPAPMFIKMEEEEFCGDPLTVELNVLRFIVEVLEHDLFSLYSKLKNDFKLEKTLIGQIFFDFNETGKANLKASMVIQTVNLFKHCDSMEHRKVFRLLIEIAAECCLYVDNGGFVVNENILEDKSYPTCQLFCQYFTQTVFRRDSVAELIPIIGILKPEWFRMQTAYFLLKRWKSKLFKGLECVIQILESNDLKNLIEDFKSSNINENYIPKSSSSDVQNKDSASNNVEKSNEYVGEIDEDLCEVLVIFINSFITVFKLREIDNSLKNPNANKIPLIDSPKYDHKFYENEYKNFVELTNFVEFIEHVEGIPGCIKLLL